MNGWTPTEAKIMAVLDDGLPHSAKDLLPSLGDEYGEEQTIRVHISNIRKKLRPRGLDILGRPGEYQQVRLLTDPYVE